jgi:hypothetical protein
MRFALASKPRSAFRDFSRCLVAQNGPVLNMPFAGTLGQIEKSRISRFAERKKALELQLVLLAQCSWSIPALEELT